MENLSIYEGEQLLSSYAVKPSETLGRRYSEKEHPLRNPFQRDRDRIIHSTAFRRLEYKTQVFIYHEGDYYRNRLTHTLEVQQIARTIARILKLNEDLVEAISLAHDIGHTPFGHKGEVVLNELLTKRGFKGFEHNRQGLRIVDKLERRYPQFPGLNLSFEVREGIIRHNTSYDIPLDEDEFEEFTRYPSPSLESQVVNLADEIAYTCHDLDDGLKSGIITIDKLKEVSLWKEIEDNSYTEGVDEEMKKTVIIRNLINHLVINLVDKSKENILRAGIITVEDVRKNTPILSYPASLKKKLEQMRSFLEDQMYSHFRVIRMTHKGAMIIRDLFNAYIEEPKQLPPHIQERMKKEPPEIVIADYIAGMTDRFALSEHKKLFDPHYPV
ncbi:MAG: deoxyguanosinetriphosphate triphosphohydrolase [Candidatus Omnitrophica bacterium]|nr:deoxyguanosinetriphosphate triphosphohydrolase [Candidatus Omnitrophota bacterium]MCM8777405.1 deoxyguanosinetriphosphate triphosphohydrolase [Candidatus Omnitrophota bacterium]